MWQDNKPVSVIATNSDPTKLQSVTRKHKDGTSHTYPCPAAVADYNKHMGGVDNNDQLRGYCHVRLKCRKYYKYVFWFLFDLMVTNSFILCRHFTDLPYKSVKEFRIALAKELIGDCFQKKTRSLLKHPSSTSLLPVTLSCSRIRERPSVSLLLQLQERHQTVWQCKECDVFLCHNGREDNCFREYHVKYGPLHNN